MESETLGSPIAKLKGVRVRGTDNVVRILTDMKLVKQYVAGKSKENDKNDLIEYWMYEYQIVRDVYRGEMRHEQMMMKSWIESPDLNKELEKMLLEGRVV